MISLHVCEKALPATREPSERLVLEGMPDVYYEENTTEEVSAHAEIASRRSNAQVHVETCVGPELEEPCEWLCVVTDDCPGLLSTISAAISAHSLDVLTARAYCRARVGCKDEAVDVFAVRRTSGPLEPLSPADITSIRRMIEALLRGETEVSRIRKHAADTVRPGSAPPCLVSFGDDATTDVLTIETSDRPGLLLAITLKLFREKLSITRSHATTLAGIARDEFEVSELDGSRLTESRKSQLVESVRAMLSRPSPRSTRTAP